MSEVEVWYKVVEYLYILALSQVNFGQNNIKSNFLLVGSSVLF